MPSPTMSGPHAVAAAVRPPAPVGDVPAALGRELAKVSAHSGVFFAGTLFTAGAGYLFKLYTARVLGAEMLGLYALGLSLVSLLGVVGSLGLGGAATRFVAAYAGTGRLDLLRGFLVRGLGTLAVVSLGLGVALALGGGWIAERVYQAPALADYVWLFAAMLPISVVSGFLGQVLGGYQAIATRTVLTSFVSVSLTIGLSVAALSRGWGLRGYLVAQLVSALVTLALVARAVWRASPAGTWDREGTRPWPDRRVVAFAGSMMAISGLEFLLGQWDRVALGIYLDATAVGIYTVAATTVGFIPVLLQSVNSIFAPIIAAAHARGDRLLLAALFRTLTKWTFALTLPFAAVVVLWAPTIMGLFGEEFRSGSAILVAGTLGQLANCGAGSVGYMLIMSGHQGALVRVQVLVGVASALAYMVVAPVWGLSGVAIAAAISMTAANLLYLAAVRRLLGLLPYDPSYRRLIGPLLATMAASVGFRWMTGESPQPALVLIAAVGVAYAVFIATAIPRALDAQERRLLGQVGGSVARVVRRLGGTEGQ